MAGTATLKPRLAARTCLAFLPNTTRSHPLEHNLLNPGVSMPQCRDLSSWHLSNIRRGVLIALHYVDRQELVRKTQRFLQNHRFITIGRRPVIKR